MSFSLEKRIYLFAFFVLALAIAASAGLSAESFRRDYRDGLLLRCQGLAGGLKASAEEALAAGGSLAEMSGGASSCNDIVGSHPEISYCLIEDALGVPLFSADPSPPLRAPLRLLSSSISVLELPDGSEGYEVALPVFEAGGASAGRVRIGFPDSVLGSRLSRALYPSLAVLGAAFALIVLFVRKGLLLPIRRLREAAGEIAGGNLEVAVPNLSAPEFSRIAMALQQMADSLRSRDGEIGRGCRELEEANARLRESFENQERISAELGRSRGMYRSLLEDAGAAIVVCDPEDRVLLINKQAEEFFGLGRGEVEGRDFFDLLGMVACEEIERHRDSFRQLSAGGGFESVVRCVRPSDGRRLVGWALGSSALGDDGRRVVQLLISDVTRERQIKENLEQSARELEALGRMKDSFLGVASHELKTPLTVILGYSELILDEGASGLEEGTREMVRNIYEAAGRLSIIVDDMVDMSMLDGDRVRLQTLEVDVNGLIEGLLVEPRFPFSSRNQTLELELDEKLPKVPCDIDRLTQLIGNLVGNAIKFTPDGGTVRVETRMIRSLRRPGSSRPDAGGAVSIDTVLHPYLEMVVSDTGIGISEEDQAHIFDKFFEVGDVTEHFTGRTAFGGKGAGLGLALVRGIVDVHGGEIWVESPGCGRGANPGSAFHVILPASSA